MVAFLQHEYEDVAPFAALLPHHLLLDPGSGVVLLSTPRWGKPTLALGCAWTLPQPRNIEMLDEAACLALARQHESLFRGLPVGSALQAILTILPAAAVPAWDALRPASSSDPIVEAQRLALRQGLPHHEGTIPGCLREVQTTVTVRIPLPHVDPSVPGVLQALLTLPTRGGEALAARLARHAATTLSQLDGIRVGIEDTFQSVGHQATRLDGVALGHLLQRSLTPRDATPRPVLPDVPLAAQLLDAPATRLPGGWRVGGDDAPCSAQVLSLHRAPPQTYPGMLSAPRAPHGTPPLALWDAWPGPLSVIVNVAVVDQAQERARMRLKRTAAFVQRFNPFGDTSPENVALKDELDTLLRQFFLVGGDLLWARVHVVLWGGEARLPRGVEDVRRQARKLDLELVPEPVLGSTLFLQTLPLGFDPAWPKETSLRRSRRLPATHLAQLLPLYGGFRGTGTPSVLYLNRRGEAVAFDPFDSLTNAHMLITGTMGAGKSFILAHLAQQFLPLDASMVILDRLPSYRDLCAAWGGRYLPMAFETPICFNPFYGALDAAHVAFLTACLAEMASGSLERLTRDMVSVLADALAHFVRGWDATRGEPRLGLFIEEVLRDGCFTDDADDRKLGRDVARKLSMFWGRGPYAAFFDSANELELDPRLTVIELAGLREASDLQGSVLFVLMHLLTQFFAAPERRFKKKFFACDETVFLLKHQTSADVLEEIELTYRKLRTSAIFLAQFAEHLNSPAGRAIRKGSPMMLFLQQEAEEIADMQHILKLTTVEVETMALARRHADHSSAYLRLPNGTGGLIRLVPDAYTRLLVGQDEETRTRREAAITAVGGDVRAGVAALVREEQGVSS